MLPRLRGRVVTPWPRQVFESPVLRGLDGRGREALMEAGRLRQYAAHVEQVTRLPEGAAVVMGNADCPIGGFVIGEGVFTTQYHPEMTHGFVTALVGEYAGKLPAEVAARAQASLAETADNARVARWIMDFFRRAGG